MAFTIASTERSDVKTLTQLNALCFQSTNAVFFDGPLKPETLDMMAEQRFELYFKSKKNIDAATIDQAQQPVRYTSLKAVDKETGEIVGESRWIVYYEDEPVTKTIEEELDALLRKPPLQMRVEPTRARARIVLQSRREVFGVVSKAAHRLPVLSGDDIGVTNEVTALQKRVYLQALLVHPGHRRKGIGRKLLQWGLEEADRHGLVACLEASEDGRGLYEQAGFRLVREISLNLAPYGQSGHYHLFVMVRQPGGCKT